MYQWYTKVAGWHLSYDGYKIKEELSKNPFISVDLIILNYFNRLIVKVTEEEKEKEKEEEEQQQTTTTRKRIGRCGGGGGGGGGF